MSKKNPIDGIYNRLIAIIDVDAWQATAVRKSLMAAYRKGRKDVEFELDIAYKSAYPPSIDVTPHS